MLIRPASLAMSTRVLKALPGKLDIKRHSSSFLYVYNRKKGASENTVMRDYVLPDYTHIKRGFIRPMEETTGKAKGNEQVRYTHYCNSNLIWHTV